MPAKKSPKSVSKKAAKSSKQPAKKAAAKKAPAKKTPAKKATAKKAPVKKTAAKKAVAAESARKAPKKDATDTIRKVQKSHKPTKQHPVKGNYVLFTIEDAREILKNRKKEEAATSPKATKVKSTKAAAPKPEVVQEAPAVKSRHAPASLDDILGISSVKTPAKQNKVPRKFQKYFALLADLRDEVRAELNLHSSDTLKRSSKDDAGDIAISVDAGTDNFDRDFALSLLSTEQDALNEIEAAIQRIYDGTYGICEETGVEIDAERLEAVPFTRFSVEGQKSHEATARKRVSRTGAFLNEDNGEKITFGEDDGDN